MLILYQTHTELHISAHRETHLRDLERQATDSQPPTPGHRWRAGPATADCRPDPANHANLVWKLYLQPTAERYTVRYRNGLICGADGPLQELIDNPDITHVQPREATEP